ncbi:septum formation family protein [Arthrobacter roseus]|uniref:septum formation family protein n=1 Tax=Arthrobacter roseus TaxID=136274 RepID=UPI00196506CB|nr:septum formation family protein [Arthrobacter roseus]MBM7847635.1 hypothetical protein [Arthrobacter roseus]
MTTWARAAGLGSLLTVSLLLGGCGLLNSGPERNEDGSVAETVDASVPELRDGDCFTDDGGTEVTLMPCEKPHEFEVFASTKMLDGEYPGVEKAETQADAFCRPAFEKFVGISYSDSELPLQFFYPQAADWSEADNRTVLCLVTVPGNKPSTGTFKSADR